MDTEDLGPTIQTDFDGFKKIAGEFFRATDATAPVLEYEAVEAGHRAVTLAYLGLPTLLPSQSYEAVVILNLATQRLVTAELLSPV